MSSRFWIMKNEINLLQPEQITRSMQCWNMISIELRNPNRTLDLIVPSQKQMDILICYLIC